MKTDNQHFQTRRTFLRNGIVITAGSTVLVACGSGSGGGLQCATSDTLSRSEMLSRNGRSYAELSRVEGRSCMNCEFFETSGEGCGSCRIDSLPANPAGHCVSWTAKQA